MSQHILKTLRNFHEDENGQAYVEYFLVVVIGVVGLAESFKLFNRALQEYYTRISQWLTLPFG